MAKITLRDENEIDAIVDCFCGKSFHVYVPYAAYKCPYCSSLCIITLSVKSITPEENPDPVCILGHEIYE